MRDAARKLVDDMIKHGVFSEEDRELNEELLTHTLPLAFFLHEFYKADPEEGKHRAADTFFFILSTICNDKNESLDILDQAREAIVDREG